MFGFLSDKFSSILSKFSGSKQLNEDQLRSVMGEVQNALIDADVPLEVVQSFVDQVKKEVVGKKIQSSINAGEYFIKIIYDRIVAFLGQNDSSGKFLSQKSSIIMLAGLQGSGKTTTAAKLAYAIREQHFGKKIPKILISSVDFTRPAALEQLKIVAAQAEATWYESQYKEPLRASQEILEQYKKSACDFLILDTAGRLYLDDFLLQELKQICEIVKPNDKILVLDAMTGQNSLQIAKTFDRMIGITAGILTKLDSDTRGGAAFAFCYLLKKPLLFVGTGEAVEQFEPFRPERIASRMLGMGDLKSLLERAQKKIKESERQEMESSLKKGDLTLQDFIKQIEMIGKLGSLSSVLKYIPGMNGAAISSEMIDRGEKEMKRFKAIVQSMTHKERLKPAILNGSRKNRIAKGAGVSVGEINLLLERFEQTKQFVKIFKGSGRFPGF